MSNFENKAPVLDVEKESYNTPSNTNSFDPKHEEKSRGIKRVEIISSQYGKVGTFVVFFCIFLVSYCYGLDNTVRYNFQAFAQSSFGTHSLLSTVNTAASIIAVAAQPFYARLSDYFGRAELLCVCIIFYAVGTVLESQSKNVSMYAGGAIIYQFGYTGLMLLLQLLAGDFSLLNWRLLASFIPATPFIINTWISGNLVSSLGLDKWSWGIAMWAIIVPVSCCPLLFCLAHMHWRAKKSGALDPVNVSESESSNIGFWGHFKWSYIKGHFKWSYIKRCYFFAKFLFFKADVLGLFLIIAILALILVPFSLAGGLDANWKTAKVLAPLIVGFCVIPFFVLWENYTASPVIPFQLIKDRGVWAALCIGILINWIWYMQGDYMFTVLQVAVNESYASASRITSLYSFVSVVTGTLLGFVIVKVRQLKPFIVFGACMWFVAMGLLVYYRGGSDSHSGIIGSLCLLGFGAGFFTYPTQASIQATTNHEHMAIVTSLYLASYYLGSAFGGAVSGAIWTQTLPKEIIKQLSGFDNQTMIETAYGSPFTFILEYPWGTPEREAVVIAYRHTQRLLLITGTCLCAPLIICTLLLHNPRLDSVQNMFESDADNTRAEHEAIGRKKWFERTWKERFNF
ncbi:hypothetical protein D0Z00_002517 [Geotrichum galactomycetum]|uniref:Uncharacterized protein n=1 Tax=Geotrichum galactomycetum TaxID=27317 RepID=A0ACB6V3Y8_9ASCO|nr:hypothetical protein D0Z00_002517 [Geotrichum candidum]